MMRELYLAGFYLWLGFTVGYFFRKWMETGFLSRLAAERRDAGQPAGGTGSGGGEPGDPAWRPSPALADLLAAADRVGVTRAVAGTPAAPAAAAPEEQVDEIDEQGATLRTVSRREMRRSNLLHRVTATFVLRPDGRLFMQQRTWSKDAYPGLFDVVVGGTVTSGEGYAENACRELAEELAVRGAPVHLLFQHRYQDATTNSIIQVFACEHAGPVALQPEEVADGCWVTPELVERVIAEGRLCPDSSQGWRQYRERFPGARTLADLGRLAEARGAPLAPISCAEWVGAG
ncbi:MAG: NUDIX domain-containing protein [Candidatus Lambdaproteobacteria bacterium]|nr:NUDIX domain-containing protein [Candidatus Lambdaproteobacteria bacterium]